MPTSRLRNRGISGACGDVGPRHHRAALWIAAALLLFAAYATVSLVRHHRVRRAPEPAAASPSAESDRLYLRHLDYTSYDGGVKIFSFRADEVVHRRRTIGPLTLNPVKEIEVSGARIEIFGRGPGGHGAGANEAALDLPLAALVAESLAARNLGFVSRIVIKPIQIACLRDGTRVLGLAALSATVGPDGARFRGLTIDACCGGRLAAGEAAWDAATRRLIVDGPYERNGSSASRRGERTIFRIGLDGALVKE